MRIGIDVGGSHIAIGLVEKDKIIAKKEYIWDKGEKKDFFNSVEIYAKKLIKELLLENKVKNLEKIGIGFPCGNIVSGIIYENTKSVNLPKILKKEFNVPVYLKNDVKCSAICEKEYGNLKKYKNSIFLTLGTGIGAAYFYNNELVKPTKYQGFEIGHMIIKNNGKQCKCGRKGCFEQYGSMKAFRTKVEKLFNIERITSFKMLEIIESGQKKEEVDKIIDEYISYLSIGLSNLIYIFEPDVICIGGSFAYYAPIFLERLKIKLKDILIKHDIPNIIIAKYENDAGIIGASMLEES